MLWYFERLFLKSSSEHRRYNVLGAFSVKGTYKLPLMYLLMLCSLLLSGSGRLSVNFRLKSLSIADKTIHNQR